MPDSRTDTATLRLLATTDLHAQIWPHDYDTDAPTSGQGLARLATLIRRSRCEAENTLLLDNGDLFQGSQLADFSLRTGGPHPMAAAMAVLGYDAATLGNHDFNYGLRALERWIADLEHPVTLANILRMQNGNAGDPLLPPFLVLERELLCRSGRRRRLKVGVIGAVPPQTLLWDSTLLEGRVMARGIRDSVAAQIPDLRAAGADLIVALCHSGIGQPEAGAEAEDAALSVAALDGIDAVIAGHSHRRLPGPDHDGQPGVDTRTGTLAGTPAVMPGAFASDLGLIDFELELKDDHWRVRGAVSRLQAARHTPPDPAVLAASRRAHLCTRRTARTALGRLSAPLHGLFPLVCHSPTLQLGADAQSWAAAALLDGTAEASLPLLSAVAPFKAGGTGRAPAFTAIRPGPLRLGHLTELAPFPNSLCVIEVTGSVLRLWLERGVSGYATIAPGSDAGTLQRPGAASYNFEQIFGLRYAIDLSRDGWFDALGNALPHRPDTARIAVLQTDAGRQVEDSDRYAVATSTYRAAGGGGFGFLERCRRLVTAPVPLRETLAGYVAARPAQPEPLRLFWGFAPVDATVEVLSAPRADPCRHGDGARRLTPAGTAPDGASRFLLDLSKAAMPPAR